MLPDARHGFDWLVGKMNKEVKERKKTYFVIVIKDSEGFQCYQQDDKIQVNILTPEGDQLKTDIKDTKDGKYTVTFTPQCERQHRVELLVNGRPLGGSSWIVPVHQHQYQFAFSVFFDIEVRQKTGTIAIVE